MRQIRDDDLLRYRCHTGHAFTPAALLAVQSAKIGDTLWTAPPIFKERQNLMAVMRAMLKAADGPADVITGDAVSGSD